MLLKSPYVVVSHGLFGSKTYLTRPAPFGQAYEQMTELRARGASVSVERLYMRPWRCSICQECFDAKRRPTCCRKPTRPLEVRS